MTFILDNDYSDDDPSLIKVQFEAYYRYLESVRGRLPASAYSFATAPWHYDPNDHQCPHDSWVILNYRDDYTFYTITASVRLTSTHSL